MGIAGFGRGVLIAALCAGASAHARLTISGGDPCEAAPFNVCTRPPGTVEKDSTGTSVSGEGTDNPAFAKELAKLTDKTNEHIPGILQNWRGRGIYEQRIQNLGLATDPACAGNFNSPACTQRVSDVVNAVIVNKARWGNEGRQAEFAALNGTNLSGLMDLESDSRVKFVTDLVSDQFAREVRSPNVESKLQQRYDLVKKNFVEMLREKFAGQPTLDQMIARVERTKLRGVDCRKSDNRSASQFLRANAFYSPGSETVTVCYGNAAQDSFFPLAFTIGHELGHAVDPCRISIHPRTLGEKMFGRTPNTSSELNAAAELPTKNLITCMRSTRSVGARRLSPFSTETAGFCGSDQINEAVSDWMGIETMARMLKKGELGSKSPEDVAKGMENTFADMCHSKTYSTGSGVHPATRARIERIALVQPDIRQMMRCKPLPTDRRYCAVDSTTPSSEGTAPSTTEGVR